MSFHRGIGVRAVLALALCAGCRLGVAPRGPLETAGSPVASPTSALVAERVAPPVGVRGLRQLQEHPQVDERVSHMLGRGRITLKVSLQRSLEFIPMIEQELREQGVPPELAYLPMVESRFRADAIGRRAVGLWQFTRPTARRFGLRVDRKVDERRDARKSTRAAARYLRELYDQFDSWALALAAYNAGPGRVRRALRKKPSANFFELAGARLLPPITRAYVPKVLAISLIGPRPSAYGVKLHRADMPRSAARGQPRSPRG